MTPTKKCPAWRPGGKENRERPYLTPSQIAEQALPPRRWQTWIKSGHPHEAALREDANLFWRWMPGACPSRDWARRPEPDEVYATMADVDSVRDDIQRQLDTLRRGVRR